MKPLYFLMAWLLAAIGLKKLTDAGQEWWRNRKS